MQDAFEIPVHYKNRELLIPARLLVQGYTYKIEATIDDVIVYFEPDEERNFRAVMPPEDNAAGTKLPDVALLQAIAESLTETLR